MGSPLDEATGLSYNGNDIICPAFEKGHCADGVKCKHIHVDKEYFITTLTLICGKETGLISPLVNLVFVYVSDLALEAMRMAHESKRPILYCDSNHGSQYVWKDIVCMAWYRGERDHTSGGYYRDCGLQHTFTSDDARQVDYILYHSQSFREWEARTLHEFKIEVPFGIRETIHSQVLQEGGSRFEERIRECYVEHLQRERRKLKNNLGFPDWIKAKNKKTKTKKKHL